MAIKKDVRRDVSGTHPPCEWWLFDHPDSTKGDFLCAESNNKKYTFKHERNSRLNRRLVSLYVLPWLRSLWSRTCSMIWFLISAFRSVMVAECDRLVSQSQEREKG